MFKRMFDSAGYCTIWICMTMSSLLCSENPIFFSFGKPSGEADGDRGSFWIGCKSIGSAGRAVSAVSEAKEGNLRHYLGWHLYST